MRELVQEWLSTYLRPADPIRFARELCQYPRERKIRPINFEDKIADYQAARRYKPISKDNTGRRWSWQPRRVDIKNWQPIRGSLSRRFGSSKKYWYFARYSADAWVDFISIDVDDHDGSSEALWNTVRKIESLGIPGMWTTSPGQLLEDGTLRQGLYFTIFITSPLMVEELQPIVDAIRKILELPGIEFPATLLNCRGRTTNFRFPGQHNCDAVQVNSDHEYWIRLSSNFDEFLKMFAERPKIAFEDLRAILDDLSQTRHEPAPSEIALLDSGVESDCSSPGITPHPHPDAKSHDHTVIQDHLAHDFQAAPAVGTKAQTSNSPDDNAFYRMVGREKANSSCITPHMRPYAVYASKTVAQARLTQDFEKLLAAVTQSFVHKCTPEQTDHTEEPKRLNALARRCLKHAIKTFEPTKLIPQWRRDKDLHDIQTIEHVRQFVHRHGITKLVHIIKRDCSLSFRNTQALTRFIRMLRAWNGRVAAKTIYWNSDAPFTLGQWRYVMASLIKNGCLYISGEFNKEKKICRQYCIPKMYLDKYSVIIDDVQEIIESDVKKKKQYIIWKQHDDYLSPEPSLSATDDDQNVTITMNKNKNKDEYDINHKHCTSPE